MRNKLFLVIKTKDGVLLRQVHKKQTLENHEEYELHAGEVIVLKGKYPIIGRTNNGERKD